MRRLADVDGDRWAHAVGMSDNVLPILVQRLQWEEEPVLEGGFVLPTGTRHGSDSITPTEQQVIELVQSGLSNADIGQRLLMSPRTVQTHLTHIFAKLALATRAELAAAATRRDQHTRAADDQAATVTERS